MGRNPRKNAIVRRPSTPEPPPQVIDGPVNQPVTERYQQQQHMPGRDQNGQFVYYQEYEHIQYTYTRYRRMVYRASPGQNLPMEVIPMMMDGYTAQPTPGLTKRILNALPLPRNPFADPAKRYRKQLEAGPGSGFRPPSMPRLRPRFGFLKWLGLVIAVCVLLDWFGQPGIRTSYSFSGSASRPVYRDAHYLTATGWESVWCPYEDFGDQPPPFLKLIPLKTPLRTHAYNAAVSVWDQAKKQYTQLTEKSV